MNQNHRIKSEEKEKTEGELKKKKKEGVKS